MVRTYATNPLYLRADAALPPKTPGMPQQRLLSKLRDDYHHRLATFAPNAITVRRHHSAPVDRLPDQPFIPVHDPMTTVGVTPAEQYFRSVDKAQKAEQRAALEKQIQEQKAKRINENSSYYGGVNLEALKAEKQNQSASQRPKSMQQDDPPWLRGSPQPKNGIRGTQQWQQGQLIAKSPSVPAGLNYAAPSPIANQSVQYQRSAVPFSQTPSPSPARQRLTERLKANAEDVYDPFGKGGAGAPVRDRDGNIVADRRKMRQSWSKTVDTNVPHDYAEDKKSRSNSFSNSYGAGQMPRMTSSAYSNPLPAYNTTTSLDPDLYPTFGAVDELRAIDPFAALSGTNDGGTGYVQRAPSRSRSVAQPSPIAAHQSNLNSSLGGRQMTDKERHKMELLQQIEENKRLKEVEKQKELDEEARQRRKMDEYNARQMAEVEAEKLRQKEKAIEHERRAQEAADKARQKHLASKQPVVDRPANNRAPEKDDGLEWWERQPVRGPGGGPPPSSQLKRSGSAENRSPHGMYSTSENLTPAANQSRASKRSEKPGRNSYKPSSAAVRNESVMRQLSAMRERLTKEQIRVKSALRRNEYGEDLFSDDENMPNDEEPPSLMHRSTNRRSNNKANYDEGDRGAVRSRVSDRRDSEHELIDAIRRSRAVLDTAQSRRSDRPPPRSNDHDHMGGFLSDEDDDEHPDKIVDTFLRKRK